MLNIDVRRRGDAVVVDLAGKLYGAGPAERFMDKVNSLLHQGHRKILVNLELARTMDTAGFGALISARREVIEAGGRFALINVTRRLEDMIVISGLLTHFWIFDSEAQAAAALAPSWPAARPRTDEPNTQAQAQARA